MMTPSAKVIAAMELIPNAHADEHGQRIFRTTMHDLLAAGATVADAYAKAAGSATEQIGDFEPRCNRPGLLALDAL